MSVAFHRAGPGDVPAMLAIYAAARQFMAEAGNPGQWRDGYPGEALLGRDTGAGDMYLCCEGEKILAAFYFKTGDAPEPCYDTIDGAWKKTGPYGVLHRVAVAPDAHGRGVAAACFAWCFARCGHLRIDTHRDNRPMQRALEKSGFARCGTVRLAGGEERWAYEKC